MNMKRERTLRVIGFLMVGVMLVCGLLNPTSTEAATFYVATTGHNSNPGTETQPFQTVNKGVSVLNPGDTLYIKSGTYKEWVDWRDLPAGTSWSVPVTVKAFPGDIVTLLPNTGDDFVLLFIGTQYIIIDGLILDGTNVGVGTVKITWGTSHPPAHHIRIQNSEVRNSPKQGILVDDGSNYNEFINLDIHDNGDNDFNHGMYINSKNNIIQDCRIFQNAGWGVQIYNHRLPEEAENNMVIKNKIYDNARVGNRGYGIVLGSGRGNKAYNNLIWGNQGGIEIGYGGSSNTEVHNNTIYGNKGNNGSCIHVGNSRDDSVKNNICWDNGQDIIDNGTNTVLAGNSTTNPLFVNAAGLNFHLRDGSQAIDAGVAVNGVLDDFDGTSRPQGSNHDIGAYEFLVEVDTDPPAMPKNVNVF